MALVLSTPAHCFSSVAAGGAGPLTAPLKALAKAVEARHKQAVQSLDRAEKTLRARSSHAWDGKAAREARRALLAADAKKNEPATVRVRCWRP